ncbi:MAG TPA: hypothetical protein VK013_16120 [Myxococcaceae bacterium]|nr:hypothetical protein [Myxococcaceae bacterium]
MISQAIVDPLEDLPWLEPDAADQLEVARLRFLGLTALLSPLSWHTRVAASLELLREVRIALPQVDARMDRLCQRIALEPDVPGVARLQRHLSRVRDARGRLQARAARRLNRERTRALSDLLGDLEASVVELQSQPRDEREGWALARRLLLRNLPALQLALSEAQALQPFASRGPRLNALACLPPEPGLRGVLEAHARASAAIESLRLQLLRADLSGRVIDVVWKVARSAPVGRPRHGASQLAAAIFWTDLAGARLRGLAEQLVAPVRVREEEVRPLLVAWLEAGGSRLPELRAEVEDAPAPRRALLQLALATSAPPESFHPGVSASELLGWARAAEASGEEDADLMDLKLNLRACLLRGGRDAGAADALVDLVARWAEGPGVTNA